MAWPDALAFKVLKTYNPCYSEANNELALALYEGGDYFNRLKSKLLYSRTQDKNPLYRSSRLQVAEYENHIAGMYDYSRAIAFQAKPRLVFAGPEEKLAYYKTLNDGLQDTLEGRFADMQLYGYALLTASYPANPIPDAAKNLAQQLKPGGPLDAKICYLCPATITDWKCDELGNLEWVKVYTCEGQRSVEWGKIDNKLHTWTFITKDSKAIYKVLQIKDKELVDEQLIPRIEESAIKSGLPVFEAALVNRNCVTERIKRAAVGLFNAESNWKFAVASQCFAQAWYSGSKEPGEFSQSMGEGIVLFLGPQGQYGYAVPDNVAFDAIKQLVQQETQNLQALINAEFKELGSKDQHAASGAAKEQDKHPAAVSAAAYACKLRAAVCAVVDYIITSRRDTGIVTYHFEGMDDFSPLAISDKIAAVTAYKLISGAAPTALKIAQRDLDHAMTPGATPEESTQIDEENAEMEAPAPSAISSSAPAFSQSGAATSSGPGSTAATTTASSTAAKSSSGASTGKAGAPDTGPNITIPAKLKQIDPRRVQPQHDTDKSFVATMKKKIGGEGYNPKYPALLVEVPTLHDDGGSVFKSLDAHHRIEASKELSLKSIPAYVIAFNDWLRLTNAFPFDPKQLSGLDSHIELPDGRTYDQVREKNSHTNGSQSAATSMAANSARSVAA